MSRKSSVSFRKDSVSSLLFPEFNLMAGRLRECKLLAWERIKECEREKVSLQEALSRYGQALHLKPFSEGIAEVNQLLRVRLLQRGFSISEVVAATELTVDEVECIKE